MSGLMFPPYSVHRTLFGFENWTDWGNFASTGIDLVVENTVKGYHYNLIDSMEKMKDFIVFNPELKYVIDLGHLNLTSDIYSAESVTKNNSPLKSKTKGFHVHNNHGDFDSHLSHKKGSIDFKRLKDNIFSQMKDAIYICEMNSFQDVISFRKFLNEN